MNSATINPKYRNDEFKIELQIRNKMSLRAFIEQPEEVVRICIYKRRNTAKIYQRREIVENYKNNEIRNLYQGIKNKSRGL